MLSTNIQNNSELQDFLIKYQELANKCRFDAIIPFIANDAIYWFSNGTYIGIDQIRKAFEETWENIKEEKYTISNVEWLVLTDNEAVCVYRFKSDGLVKGKRQVYEGRGTNIFKKIRGNWQIIHEHLSKDI